MTNSIFIRDTLIRIEDYNALNETKKQQLNDLISQYRAIHYIDVRSEIGPDQIQRMSQKQKDSITANMCKVFAIESQVKELLKTDNQLEAEAIKVAEIDRQARIKRIQYRIRDIENYLQRKLNSSRENPTKKEYRELKKELETLKEV